MARGAVTIQLNVTFILTCDVGGGCSSLLVDIGNYGLALMMLYLDQVHIGQSNTIVFILLLPRGRLKRGPQPRRSNLAPRPVHIDVTLLVGVVDHCVVSHRERVEPLLLLTSRDIHLNVSIATDSSHD